MNIPTGFSRAKFRRPFKLKGVAEVQPPGTYTVEVRDERTGWFKFLQTTTVSTWIRITHSHGVNGTLKDLRVKSRDLAAALRRDKRPQVTEFDNKERTKLSSKSKSQIT